MKRIVLAFLLFACLISCSKKDNVDPNDIPKDIPAWLQSRIAEMKKSEDAYLYVVSEYKIDGMIFYTITPSYSSCMFCDLYDSKGIKANIAFTGKEKIEHVRAIWPVA